MAQSWPMEPEKIPSDLKKKVAFLRKTDQPNSMSIFFIGGNTFILCESRTAAAMCEHETKYCQRM